MTLAIISHISYIYIDIDVILDYVKNYYDYNVPLAVIDYIKHLPDNEYYSIGDKEIDQIIAEVNRRLKED